MSEKQPASKHSIRAWIAEDEAKDRAHLEAVEDALHQLDFVRRFTEGFAIRHNYNPHVDLKYLFWPAGIARN
jgi:hypothetical protein